MASAFYGGLKLTKSFGWVLLLMLGVAACSDDDDDTSGNGRSDAGSSGGSQALAGAAGVAERVSPSAAGAPGAGGGPTPAQGGASGSMAAPAGATGLAGGSSAQAGASPGLAGSAGAAGGPDYPAAPELDALPALLADTLCRAYQRCFGPLFDAILLEDCAELTEKRVRQSGFDRIQQDIEAGVIEYEPTSVGACLRAYDRMTCSDMLQRDLDVCQEALDGTLERGDECMFDDECAGDSICLTEQSCPGRCAPRQTAGEACAKDGQCADGLVCSEVTELCTEPAGEGESCGGGVETQCAPGLLCLGADTNEARAGTCRLIAALFTGAEGDSCDIQQGPLCSESLGCTIERVSANGADAGVSIEGTCVTAVPAGTACYLAFPGECPKGEYCDIQLTNLAAGTRGTCRELPGAGEPCAGGLAGNACAANTRCVDGTCRALRHLGQSCSSKTECYSETCVDGGCVPSGGC